MSWVNKRIEEVAQIIDGDRGKNYPSQSEFYDEGYCLFLNTGNVTVEGFRFDKCQFVSKEKDLLLRKGKLQRGDIVYTTRGTVGNAGYYGGAVPYDNIRINSGMVVLRAYREIADERFLYQLIKSKYQKDRIKSHITGSAQPQLPIKNMSQIQILLPPIETQKRIADILSAYDDLIENNKKQIKLLEEAAMRLYQEWFVKLRFPGHETAKIVDGVPEGWESGLLDDYIQVNGKSVDKKYPFEQIQYIDIGSVRLGSIDERTPYSIIQAPGRAKRLARNGDTIWGMVRPNLRAHALVLEPHEDDVFSTGFAILTPQRIPYSFLYCLATQDGFVGYLVNCTNGAAYPAVKAEHFQNAVVTIPDESLLNQFHKYASPYFEKSHLLRKENESLRQARDKLLPKLMSGEIEV